LATADYPFPIAGLFARNWWVLLLRGIVAILFGILAFRRPLITLATLVILFGVYAMVDGIFSIYGAFSGWQHREDRWLLLLEGLLGLGAGLFTLWVPHITTIALMFFIAAWALATGVLRIVEAIRLRREISGEFWLGLSGAAAIFFAIMVFMRPTAGALAMVWLIGWFAFFLGITQIMLAFRVRRIRSEYRRAELPRDTRPRAA
jgi:uncharacterized membrane protein HdeD (DUF308 family)